LIKKTKKNLLLVNQSIGSLFNDVVFESSINHKVTIFYGSSNQHKYNGIITHKSKKYNNKTILKRFYTWIFFTIDLIRFLYLKNNKFQKILFVTNPPFAPLIGIIGGSSYSIFIFDLYPEIIENRYPRITKILPCKLFIKIWIKLNQISFNKAEYVFTLSNEMSLSLKRYIKEESDWENKVKLIKPWFSINENIGNKFIKNSFKEKFSDKKRLLISYSGNIGISHPIEFIIQSIPLISKHAKFIIVSNGSRFNKLKDMARKLGIKKKDLYFIKTLNEKEYLKSLDAIDLSIVALDKFASKESIPSKTFNSLLFGKPILGLSYKDSSLANLIKKYKCGINIEPKYKNLNFLIENLKTLNNKRMELEILSSNAKKASKDFSKKNVKKLMSYWINDEN
tara:strand:+ start:1054 stop:2238 length:1185 start_codon:yes stop_codon:yes gene_type:complete